MDHAIFLLNHHVLHIPVPIVPSSPSNLPLPPSSTKYTMVSSPISPSNLARSSHAKGSVVLDEEDRERVVFDTKDGEDLKMALLVEGTPTNTYTVSLPSLYIPPTRLLTPFQEYADPERSNPRRPHSITAFAVAPDKSQLTTRYLDGTLDILYLPKRPCR
ncbi:hypothetical protein D9758_015061 [Tetrapyrgos nigripes]|uniref:Uncharacterized protein n=1 Tax=Tetrapyrgos nigripes TaxID=182062 RepID=A0A8H5FSU1_9AGAR|nr:hypothetical protein D9758_015061 [Tetrapyrgos nigripes]